MSPHVLRPATSVDTRFVELRGLRADAMVLDDNDLAHPAWEAAGYAPQPRWSRWVKPIGAMT